MNYLDNELHGMYRLSDSTGMVLEEGKYAYGMKSGTWTERDSKGKLVLKENFHKGKLHGTCKYFTSKKNGHEVVQYDLGRIKKYCVIDNKNSNDTISYLISSRTDKKAVCVKRQRVNDTIETQTYLLLKSNKDTLKRSDFSFYYKDVFNNKQSERGYLHGTYTKKNLKGDVVFSGKYKLGMKTGAWVMYIRNQQVYKLTTYNNQNMTTKYFNIQDSTLYTGVVVWIDDAKNQKWVKSLKDGILHGKTKVYDINTGDLVKKIKYKNGIRK